MKTETPDYHEREAVTELLWAALDVIEGRYDETYQEIRSAQLHIRHAEAARLKANGKEANND